jgi:hypothetical protein
MHYYCQNEGIVYYPNGLARSYLEIEQIACQSLVVRCLWLAFRGLAMKSERVARYEIPDLRISVRLVERGRCQCWADC